MKIQHTPLPWGLHTFQDNSLSIGQLVLEKSTDLVANLIGPEDIATANGQLVVRAVNAHAKLVKALKDLLSATSRIDDEYYETIVDAENSARHTLAEFELSCVDKS